MKTVAIALVLSALAVPASAAVVWDEGVNGDLSSDAANPTAIVFANGSNTISGIINGNPGIDRDFTTFTIGAGLMLSHVNLIVFSPDDIGFSAFNAGATSFVPSGSTNGSFLSGIHLDGLDVGMDLIPFFDTRSVTTNSLPAPNLGPGTCCWLIQQTGPLTQAYTVEFVVEPGMPVDPATWGNVKALYR